MLLRLTLKRNVSARRSRAEKATAQCFRVSAGSTLVRDFIVQRISARLSFQSVEESGHQLSYGREFLVFVIVASNHVEDFSVLGLAFQIIPFVSNWLLFPFPYLVPGGFVRDSHFRLLSCGGIQYAISFRFSV